jgi:hypothetical protein
MEKISPEKRMWRALFRIVGVSENTVALVLPGWDSEHEIYVSRSKFPPELSRKFKEGFRFFGKANIGCEEAEELEFSDFEIDSFESEEQPLENAAADVHSSSAGSKPAVSK